jgi:hypothetical protein
VPSLAHVLSRRSAGPACQPRPLQPPARTPRMHTGDFTPTSRAEPRRSHLRTHTNLFSPSLISPARAHPPSSAQTRCRRRRPEPSSCPCCCPEVPKVPLQVTNLPCPLLFPSLLSVARNSPPELSGGAEPPHRGPPPFGALPRCYPRLCAARTSPDLSEPSSSPWDTRGARTLVSSELPPRTRALPPLAARES